MSKLFFDEKMSKFLFCRIIDGGSSYDFFVVILFYFLCHFSSDWIWFTRFTNWFRFRPFFFSLSFSSRRIHVIISAFRLRFKIWNGWRVPRSHNAINEMNEVGRQPICSMNLNRYIFGEYFFFFFAFNRLLLVPVGTTLFTFVYERLAPPAF